MTSPAAARFLADRVLTASPLQRVVMLYDRALLDVDRARLAAASGDPSAASGHVTHAVAVVSELRGSLDPGAWDGGPGLADLYAWVLAELLSDLGATDDVRLAAVRAVLADLRGTWATLLDAPQSLAVAG